MSNPNQSREQRSGDLKGQNRAQSVPFNPLEGVTPINEPLSVHYGRQPDTYLVNGVAYKVAKKLVNETACKGDKKTKGLSSSQLRKVLNVTKEAQIGVTHGDTSFQEAQKQLFILMPMLAYNYSRASNKDKPFFGELLKFIYQNVNPKSIQSAEDINIFGQIITAVVAYHKFLGGKE